MAKTKWTDVPIKKTPKGVAMKLGTIYYYPHAEKLDERGHGNLVVGDVNIPFEDEVEFLEGISRILRHAKQVDAKAATPS
jgi:hypothetical protein